MAHGRRPQFLAVCSACATSVLFLVWLALRIGGESGVRYFDDIVTALAAIAACVACWSAARRHPNGGERRFWNLLATALAAWSFAEVLWAVYDLVLRVPVPVPSWADVGYLGAIPLAAAALLAHPARQLRGAAKTRAMLDGTAVGVALFLLSWTLVLGPLWHTSDLGTGAGLVAVAYPLGDVLMIFLVVGLIRSAGAIGRTPLIWVLAGVLAMAVSDSTYTYLTEIGRYSTGNLIDTGWVVAYLAIAAGAVCDRGESVETVPADAEATLGALVTPYVPVLLALMVITVKLELHHSVDRVSWLTGFGLALLAAARQVLFVVDRRQELFGSRAYRGEPADGPVIAGGGEPEAVPWPNFFRRSP